MQNKNEKRDQHSPEIRFRGFSDEWDEKNLEDITCKIGSGKTPKGGESNYVFEGIPLIRSQNIYNNLVDLKDVAYVTIKTHEEMQNSCVSKNDVLLNITGASIGRSAVYRLDHDANVNQHVCIIRLVEGYNSGFLQLHLSSSKGQNQIDNNQAGGAREGLNFRQIGRMYFKFPTIDEQTQIDEFFQQIDRLISQHQQKHDKLLNIKKALLEKMFPRSGKTEPEIRFKGFSGEWDEKKLSELCEDTYGGGTPSTYTSEYWEGNIPWIQSSDLIENSLDSVQSKKTITEKGLANSATKLIPGNSIAIVTRVGFGKISLMYNQYTTSQDFLSLSKLKIDSLYGAYSIWKTIQREKNTVQGTSIKGVTKDELLSKKILVPVNKIEQSKIGNLFQQLDRLISQHQTQIQKLNHLKQAFLSKMFV